MDGEQAHFINCPVCFTLPENEIYQCKNGHTICHKCCDNLELCPQCQVPFEEEKIRNRALEDLIATMPVVCDYRKSGCKTKLPRKELEAHHQVCQYRPCCQIVGLKFTRECNVPFSNPESVFRHLSEEHGIPVGTTHEDCGKFFHLRLDSILEYMKNQKESTTFWFLWEVRTGFFKKMHYLVCHHVDFEQGDYSVFGMHIGKKEESKKYSLTIKVKTANKDRTWSWTGIPTHFKESGSLKANPPFKIPIRYMLDMGNRGGLYYKLNFTKN